MILASLAPNLVYASRLRGARRCTGCVWQHDGHIRALRTSVVRRVPAADNLVLDGSGDEDHVLTAAVRGAVEPAVAGLEDEAGFLEQVDPLVAREPGARHSGGAVSPFDA